MFTEEGLNGSIGVLFNNSSYVVPTQYYLGLCKNAPSPTGVITGEPDGSTGYQRFPLPVNSSTFTTPSGGIVSNINSVKMSNITSDAGSVGYWFLSKSLTGNAIMFESLEAVRQLVTDSQVSINAGEMRIGIKNI